jgi:hypothetical protein
MSNRTEIETKCASWRIDLFYRQEYVTLCEMANVEPVEIKFLTYKAFRSTLDFLSDRFYIRGSNGIDGEFFPEAYVEMEAKYKGLDDLLVDTIEKTVDFLCTEIEKKWDDTLLEMENLTPTQLYGLENGDSTEHLYELEKLDRERDDIATPLKVLCETKILGSFVFNKISLVLESFGGPVANTFRRFFYYAIDKHNRNVSRFQGVG